MNQYLLIFTTLLFLAARPPAATGQTNPHVISVNFSAEKQTSYRLESQRQQRGQEYSVSVFELYRDSILLLQHAPKGNCEFISDVLIIDEVKAAGDNYRALTTEERTSLNSRWLDVLPRPLHTGIFVKCWWCMGETVFQFPFPD